MGKFKAFFNTERVILLCAAFALYANTLFNQYAIDDSFVTQKDNISTQGLKVIPGILTSNYGTDESGKQFDYRPLGKVSFAVEHQFFGVNPFVSHFFNIVLYIVCLFLIYRFLHLFEGDPKSKLPFYATLLFAFLPIHTEVVASLKNRDILLCLAFCLLAAITILKAHVEKKYVLRYALAVFYLYVAFLAKFDALPFIAILPMMVLVKFKPKLYIILLCFFIFGLALFFNRVTAGHFSEAQVARGYCYFENPLYHIKGISHRIVAVFDCLGFYFAQCVYPVKQVCYYGADTVTVTLLTGYGILGIVLACVLFFGLIYSFRKQKGVLFLGIFMFVASTSMYLNLAMPAVGIVADRFIFFGSLGFCIALISLLQPSLSKKPVQIIALLILSLFSFTVISRNFDWKNSNILIAADFPKYPNSAYLNYLYATSVMDTIVKEKNKMPEAELKTKAAIMQKCLERSVSISNDYPRSLGFLSSVLLFMQKDPKAALPVINRALQIQSSDELLFYKGVCLHELKQTDSSEFYLERLAGKENIPYPVTTFLAQSYNARGAFEKTIKLLNKSLEKGEESETLYNAFATTYLAMKDTLSAEFYCQKALSVDPQSKKAQEILHKIIGRQE